jgi:hypothetical protein
MYRSGPCRTLPLTFRLLLPFLSPTKLLCLSLAPSLPLLHMPNVTPSSPLLSFFSNTSCFLQLLLFLILILLPFFHLRSVPIHLPGTRASTRDWSAGYGTSQDHYQQERCPETALVQSGVYTSLSASGWLTA